MTKRKKPSLLDTWKLPDGRSIGDVRVHELPALAEASRASAITNMISDLAILSGRSENDPELRAYVTKLLDEPK